MKTRRFNRLLVASLCVLVGLLVGTAFAGWKKGFSDTGRWFDPRRNEIAYPKLYQGWYYDAELVIGRGESDDNLVVKAYPVYALVQHPAGGYSFKPQKIIGTNAFLFVVQKDKDGRILNAEVTEVTGETHHKVAVVGEASTVEATISLETKTSSEEDNDIKLIEKTGKAPNKILGSVSADRF